MNSLLMARRTPDTSGIFEYSLDKSNWSPMVISFDGDGFPNGTKVTFGNGQKLYLRGINTQLGKQHSTSLFYFVNNNVKIKVSGNIMALLDYRNPPTTIPDVGTLGGVFGGVFAGFDFEYEDEEGGYYHIATAPLEDASELLLPQDYNLYCYWGLFLGCKALRYAPTLPAAPLQAGSCHEMFDGCSSLSYLICRATDISATNCTLYMLSSVSQAGELFCPSSVKSQWEQKRGTNYGPPTGWTIRELAN